MLTFHSCIAPGELEGAAQLLREGAHPSHGLATYQVEPKKKTRLARSQG